MCSSLLSATGARSTGSAISVSGPTQQVAGAVTRAAPDRQIDGEPVRSSSVAATTESAPAESAARSLDDADRSGDVAAATLAAHEVRWRRIRRRCYLAYAVALGTLAATVGIPTDRIAIFVIIMAGLGTTCLGRGWDRFRQVVLDWLPFTAILVAYDYTRGVADQLGIATHFAQPAHADIAMFGVVPTYWLQQHLFVPGIARWYDVVVTLVYLSHFLATPIVAVVLWLQNRSRWTAFIRRIVVLTLLGLTTYIVYPSAPPWLAAEHGVIQPVVRISSIGWMVMHLGHAGNVLNGAQAGANLVAAMPSLHTAEAVIVAGCLIGLAPRWAKPIIACYPLLMGFILIYSAEHYVIDVLAGLLYGVVVLLAVSRMEVYWARRNPQRQTADEEVASPRREVETAVAARS